MREFTFKVQQEKWVLVLVSHTRKPHRTPCDDVLMLQAEDSSWQFFENLSRSERSKCKKAFILSMAYGYKIGID